MPRKSTEFTRAAARGAAAALLAAGAVGAAGSAPARADTVRTVTCTYTLSSWLGGFVADVHISNQGPEIDGWTVRWTFTDPTVILATWSSQISQDAAGVVTATPASYNPVIRAGQALSFGWSARAASTRVPSDLTINGVPC
jgi:ABC-type glycerol-3-phosphate transport system substrate-binding protein